MKFSKWCAFVENGDDMDTVDVETEPAHRHDLQVREAVDAAVRARGDGWQLRLVLPVDDTITISVVDG